MPVLAGPWQLDPGEYFSEFRAGFFSADTYHRQNGTRALLGGGGLHEEYSLISYNELGWKKHTSFIFAVPTRNVVRRTQTLPDPPSATGFADGLLGFRYNLSNASRAISVELDWRPPLGYKRNHYLSHADSVLAGDRNGDGDSLDFNVVREVGQPTLGEGVQDLSLVVHVGSTFPGWKAFAQASGGYRYRFEDFADQIVASADIGMWLTHTVMLSANYVGEIAMGEGDNPTLDPDRHLVGGRVVYRVDERLDVFAGSLHTAKANNALHTDEIYVGVSAHHTKLNRLQGFLGGAPER
jgi:hypothetical protein